MTQPDLQHVLLGSPYSIVPAGAQAAAAMLDELGDRVETLRSRGRLTPDTLRRYYGSTRYEEVAESNAIEGSTLSAGETELAILKGVTLTGHDPGYVRDAVALDKALTRLAELAKDPSPTDIPQVKELHELILEGRPSAGNFRNVPVRISGSSLRPPKDWKAVMNAMDHWEKWSLRRRDISPILRATILHAWFVHIHPFEDGNGRVARAISNLELVRAGYPPIIIRRTQDRDRYVSALQVSDQAGDIAQFLDLVVDRFKGALLGLEMAAREMEGYDPAVAKMRRAQGRRLEVWNKSVELLLEVLIEKLAPLVEQADGEVSSEAFSKTLSLDEYISLCSGTPVSQSWAFRVRACAPGLREVERLAWIGFRSDDLRSAMGQLGDRAPSLFWSKRNPQSYPPWVKSTSDAPGAIEMTITPGVGDDWHIRNAQGQHEALSTTTLARRIADGFVQLMSA